MMNPPDIVVNHAVTLIGAGRSFPEVVKQALTIAPILFAADGGANAALDMGYMPDGVIGDLDSLTPEIPGQLPVDKVFRLADQDSTDFDKCLSAIQAPLILATGFTGQRLDHELAAYSSLVRHPDQRCILLGEVDLCFLAPISMRIELPVGSRFSLFPLSPCRVDATGLRWPVEALEMAPDGIIGTSNETKSTEVILRVSSRKLLVILPRIHLKAAIEALTGGI
ncbi:thiamine diphosphokinase [Profundibacter sp.]